MYSMCAYSFYQSVNVSAVSQCVFLLDFMFHIVYLSVLVWILVVCLGVWQRRNTVECVKTVEQRMQYLPSTGSKSPFSKSLWLHWGIGCDSTSQMGECIRLMCRICCSDEGEWSASLRKTWDISAQYVDSSAFVCIFMCFIVYWYHDFNLFFGKMIKYLEEEKKFHVALLVFSSNAPVIHLAVPNTNMN